MSHHSSNQHEKKRKRGHVGWDDELWVLRFAGLLDFVSPKGHTRMPAKYPADTALGAWFANQRYAFQQGKLPDEDRRRLDAIGPEWKETEWPTAPSPGGPDPGD